ncbi:MAG: flagellar hook-length control protein FliK [Peptococcales bacterium]
MDIGQLFNLEVAPKVTDNISTNIPITGKFLDKFEQNLFQLKQEKTEINGELVFSHLSGLENLVLPFLNIQIRSPEQVQQLTNVQSEIIPKSVVAKDQNVVDMDHIINLASNLSHTEDIVSDYRNEIFVKNSQPITSELDVVEGKIVSSPGKIDIPTKMESITAVPSYLKNNTLSNFADISNLPSDKFLGIEQKDYQITENLKEQTQNFSFLNQNRPKGKIDLPDLGMDTSYNNALENQLNKEINSPNLAVNNQSVFLFKKNIGNFQVEQEPEVSPRELPEFLLRQIKNNFKFDKLTGTSELNLRLKPEELGKMMVRLFSQDGQVSLKIFAENLRAKEILEQNLIHLKQTFTSQGIKCSNIDVQVSTDSSFNQFMGQGNHPFNQTMYRNNGKYKFSGNGKKELQIRELTYNDNSNSSTRRMMLGGLEILA